MKLIINTMRRKLIFFTTPWMEQGRENFCGLLLPIERGGDFYAFPRKFSRVSITWATNYFKLL